jgi:hypothetical protein
MLLPAQPMKSIGKPVEVNTDKEKPEMGLTVMFWILTSTVFKKCAPAVTLYNPFTLQILAVPCTLALYACDKDS